MALAVRGMIVFVVGLWVTMAKSQTPLGAGALHDLAGRVLPSASYSAADIVVD